LKENSGSPRLPGSDLFHLYEINPFNSIKKNGYLDGPVFWFAYARQALAAGLQILGLRAGDKVLVPDYICNVIESAFYDLNIKIIYYPIKTDLTPDFDEIEKKTDKETKAFLSVNYFGYPGPMERIMAYCSYHNLFFIEDNAHGFLSKNGDQWLGRYGAISITSIRKSFPVPHGAILRINGNPAGSIFPPPIKNLSNKKHRVSVYYLKKLLKRFLPQFFKKPSMEQRWSWVNVPLAIPDKYMEIGFNGFVKGIVQFINYKSFCRNKINQYEALVQFIKNQKIFSGRLLYDTLPDGVVPLQIPVVLNDQDQNRSDLLTLLNRKGIASSYWPDLPDEVIANPDRFPVANYLKDNLIHFALR